MKRLARRSASSKTRRNSFCRPTDDLGELRTLTDYLNSWRVYNVDATMAKRSTGGSDAELDRYGENIAPYLARILRDERTRERLLGHLREAVPYIQNIRPDRVLTFQTLRFTEQDTGSDFQLADMSDGTIRLLGLLSVLRQPVPPAVVVIEEPELRCTPMPSITWSGWQGRLR